jgi:hypothetical protein
MQERLEAFTCGGIQHRFDGLRTIRLLLQPLHASRVKGMDDVTDRLDGTPTSCAMGFGDSLRALARTIWARRTRQASALRRSAANYIRSASVTGRIKRGGFIAQVYHGRLNCIRTPVEMH